MDYDYVLDYEDPHDIRESVYDYGEGNEDYFSKLTLDQIYYSCLQPTLYGSFKSVSQVFICCLVYRLSLMFIKKPSSYQHIISILTGLLSLYTLFLTNLFYIILLLLLSYFLLFFITKFHFKRFANSLLILSLFGYLCICELWLVDIKKWHQIRGPQMLIAMKSISVAFDLEQGKIKKIPSITYYAGYILCPASCIFGPWISFNYYCTQFECRWSIKSLRKLILKTVLAFFFLTVSTCWSEYFIPKTNWKWITAYREAFSFRTSHYFISYLSEVTLIISGYSFSGFNSVTNPLWVEFPRSLVNVVIYWNVPMHTWLKTYIFSTSRKFGNFIAVLFTYIISSLLHGVNFQLSAVLLSLGIYSYVEVMLRKKLAVAFNACILAKNCKTSCWHKYKKYHPLVLVFNTFLVLLTVFHLAYLGVVFDSSQDEETGYNWQHSLEKWASLDFLSHYVALFTYIIYFLIK